MSGLRAFKGGSLSSEVLASSGPRLYGIEDLDLLTCFWVLSPFLGEGELKNGEDVTQ